jgi:hypothetical protein
VTNYNEGILMKHVLNALAGALACLPIVANAATIHVANKGVDAPGCGTVEAPCRSISAGIAIAVEDDTVLAQPGRYGELDGDDVLGGTGEETGNFTSTVFIDKRVKVLSTHGAAATVIRGTSSRAMVVYIFADGAQFGDRNQGFTVYGANSHGVSNNNMSAGKVSGNIAHGMAVGFYIVSIGGEVEISHNTAVNNYGWGIIGASAGDTAGSTFIHHNIVVGVNNSTGIAASEKGAHRVIANHISNNHIGLQVGVGPSRVMQNIITDSWHAIVYAGQCLFCTPAPTGTPLIVRNSLIGNRYSALWVSHLAEFPLTFRQNNLFANGNGCAISTSTTVNIDARQNFWGTPSGPGFTPPSAGVCSTHDVVRTTPFATAEIPVN